MRIVCITCAWIIGTFASLFLGCSAAGAVIVGLIVGCWTRLVLEEASFND